MKITSISKKDHFQEEVSFKTFKFPGGEINVQLNNTYISPNYKIQIIQHICNSDDLMELLLATNALRKMFVKDISVVIPYVPYARQDRVMVAGEALSIEVFADIINAQNYSMVTILDPHSSVTPALIKNVNIIENKKFVLNCFENLHGDMKFFKLLNQTKDNIFIVSPDAGALKKVENCVKVLIENNYIGSNPIIIGSKTRDVTNGKILGTTINIDKIPPNNTCVIIDDICDGGRTFIELAKVLKEHGAENVCLLTTHGIFSKGVEVLYEDINVVMTTDSFREVEEEKELSFMDKPEFRLKKQTRFLQFNFLKCL